MPEIPEDELVARARERGLTLDPARAAALRPQLESLLARLARLAEVLPGGVAPPPPGPPPGGDE
jgi:hypothetical protein